MTKKDRKDGWRVTFDISPDAQVKSDGTPYHMTTGSVQHGDQVFMAEFPLTEWSADMTAFFEKARTFFFEIELNPLPDDPDMQDTAESADPDSGIAGEGIESSDDNSEELTDDDEKIIENDRTEYFPETGDDFLLSDKEQGSNTASEQEVQQQSLF